MNTEAVTNRCPKCHALLARNAPQGLCPRCLLAAAAAPTETGAHAEKEPPPSFAAVAAAFPQLEIVELIGHGGMGLVYKARQPRLDRFVALKLLPQSLAADSAFAERFNREGRVLARLNHPNIVTVHDFGQANGFFYLLMEFVDGVNLRQAMHAAHFTPQQAMMLVPRICEALQFAHDEGILHRDIKPENILLDTRGRVKIADFGIAKLVGEAREPLALTASGLAVGTPHYMAPEQLEKPGDVDQRADIYSLGVVFYEMLTGELPIGRFAPPSSKTSVDPRVDEIVFHALEKEREKRFRTATEVKTSVEAITSGGTAPNPYGMASSECAASARTSEPPPRSTCYFNTPQEMADCFASAAARIFACRGELSLEAGELVYTSQWRTTLRIPLKVIEDVSIGQFQMWTTPWIVKYARVDFLSISFRREGKLETVHLTPVPAPLSPVAQINNHVGLWFDWIQQALRRTTGATPHASAPASLVVSAEPSWNRKGIPLVVAFAATTLAAWMLMPQPRVPMIVWLPAFTVSILMAIGMLWFAFGFLHANHSLWRGNLDSVTSEDPTVLESAGGSRTTGPVRRKTSRAMMWYFIAALVLGLAGPIAFLLWETSMYPLFAEKIFGSRYGASANPLVLDATISQFSPGARDPRTVGGGVWRFNCLVPSSSLARIWFVRWTNGVPIVEAGLSGYWKTGPAPGGVDLYIECEPPDGSQRTAVVTQPQTSGYTGTNGLVWNVNLGFNYTFATYLPAKPTFRVLDTPPGITVRPGHQRVIPLVEFDPQPRAPKADRIELRVLLEPLKTPAIRTVPSEKEIGNMIGSSGIDLPMDQALKLMKRLPEEDK